MPNALLPLAAVACARNSEGRLIFMSINDLAKMLGDACYVFLAINFLWGLYNIIMGFRRVKELSFRNHDEQAEFMDEVLEPLRGGQLRHGQRNVRRRCPRVAAIDSPGGLRTAAWATTRCGRS